MLRPAMRFDHLAFPSFDVRATHRFYTEVLQLPLVTAYSGLSPEWGNRAYVMMIYDVGYGEQLVFFGLAGMKRPPSDGLPRDIRHLALTASSAAKLDGWRTRLRKAGVSFWEEDHGNQQSIYFSDPNDLVLEITFPASQKALERDAGAESVVAAWLQAREGARTRPVKSTRTKPASRAARPKPKNRRA